MACEHQTSATWFHLPCPLSDSPFSALITSVRVRLEMIACPSSHRSRLPYVERGSGICPINGELSGL